MLFAHGGAGNNIIVCYLSTMLNAIFLVVSSFAVLNQD